MFSIPSRREIIFFELGEAPYTVRGHWGRRVSRQARQPDSACEPTRSGSQPEKKVHDPADRLSLVFFHRSETLYYARLYLKYLFFAKDDANLPKYFGVFQWGWHHNYILQMLSFKLR